MGHALNLAPAWFKGNGCSGVPDFAVAKEACRRHDFDYWLGSDPANLKSWQSYNDKNFRNNIKALAQHRRRELKKRHLWGIIRWFKMRTLDTWVGDLYHWGVDTFGESSMTVRPEGRLNESNPFLRDIWEREQNENYARDRLRKGI